MYTSIHLFPVLSAAALRCHCGLFIFSFPFSSCPLQTVDSLSNKKQMGDLCCGLLPNGANSHYSVCKRLCLFSSSFTTTPCTILPSDVFNTCFQCRHVFLTCPVSLITGYYHVQHKMGNRHQISLFCRAAYRDLLPCYANYVCYCCVKYDILMHF